MATPLFSREVLQFSFNPTPHQQSFRLPIIRIVIIGTLIQFAIIMAIVFICYQFVPYYSQIISIPCYVMVTLVILLLFINTIYTASKLILGEIWIYYQYKIFIEQDRSSENVKWYKFFTETNAMKHYKKRKDDNCAICTDDLNDNPTESKYVLNCGHIYHQKCIDQYEKFKKIGRRNTVGRCPICRKPYHYKFSRFTLNTNYFDDLSIIYHPIPTWYKPFYYFFRNTYWDIILPEYQTKNENKKNSEQRVQQQQ